METGELNKAEFMRLLPLVVADSNVVDIIARFVERAELGLENYTVTTDRTDLSDDEWYRHHQDELMDALVYTQKKRKTIPRVVIEVSGGCVQEVRASTAIDVILVDHDNIKAGATEPEFSEAGLTIQY
jgi:hypothetical protein